MTDTLRQMTWDELVQENKRLKADNARLRRYRERTVRFVGLVADAEAGVLRIAQADDIAREDGLE